MFKQFLILLLFYDFQNQPPSTFPKETISTKANDYLPKHSGKSIQRNY